MKLTAYPRPPASVEKQAAWWRINRRTALRLRDKGLDLRDVPAVLAWLDSQNQKKVAHGMMEKATELRGGNTAEAEIEVSKIPGQSDPDWADFDAQVRTEDPKDAMAKIAKARDWAYFKFEKVSKLGDRRAEKHYSDLLAKMEATLHDMQLRAKRLGIDAGDLYPRAEHERVIAAWAYHAMRCVDGGLAALCRKAVGLPSAEAARVLLEPFLLSAAYWEPFQHAAKIATGNAMPAWFAAKMADAVDDFVEEKKTSHE